MSLRDLLAGRSMVEAERAHELMRTGRFERVELIPWGSNYTFAVELCGEGDEKCIGVYKPRKGEMPLGDFPSGTLYKREVAAYELSQALGWDMIPLTIVREDGPHGPGSLQLFIDSTGQPEETFTTLQMEHADQLQRMALFDALANNADRKGGHCLLDPQGHLWGIDHGLTFNYEPKLRTIIWDYRGEHLPMHLVDCLAELRGDLERVTAVQNRLAPYLHEIEIDALFQRWDVLLADPYYPQPRSQRSVPWPPF